MTEVGIVAGTPAYMSPEQAIDGPVDFRSDLFSLGVVLYQAASGQIPFVADSPYVLLYKIRTAEAKPLNEVDPELPNWFCSIVHRLLEKEPEHRVSSAQELVSLLDRTTTITPLTARRTAGYVAVGMIALVAVLSVLMFLLGPTQRPILPTSSVVPSITGFVVEGKSQTYRP